MRAQGEGLSNVSDPSGRLLACVLVLAACLGCNEGGPVTQDQPQAAAETRLRSTTIGSHGSLWISEVEIDGEAYIIVNTNNGNGVAVTICPKVKPPAAKGND